MFSNVLKKKLVAKFESYDIDQLAKDSNFQCRKPRKITALNFILGFMQMLSTGTYSLKIWAENVSHLIEEPVSRQAIMKKLQFRHENFAKYVLEAVIKEKVNKAISIVDQSKYFTAFSKVYIEDSTCLNLPSILASAFPGSHSKTGEAATARIQLRIDLQSGQYCNIDLKNYRNNDQSYAYEITEAIQVGELIIRDLGYFVLGSYEKIIKKGAFFLSRYHRSTKVYDPVNKQEIDLKKELKKYRQSGKTVFDKLVLLGKKQQLPVRIVAVLAPPHVVEQRKRAAKKNRDKRLKPCKGKNEFLSWSLFVTNVEASIWTVKNILTVYGFRWRIEMIFKCWKTNFRLKDFFVNKFSCGPAEIVIVIHLFLVFLALFYIQYYNYFTDNIYKKSGRFLSVFKFAEYFKRHFLEIITSSDLSFHLLMATKKCCYEKRKSRKNQMELIYVKK